MANKHIYQNSLIITGSVTASQGFYGDGSGLTGITAVAEWDGSRNGDANITGSFVVSGSSARVDFLLAEGGVSGSFSGSFQGDGSSLNNLAAGSNTQVQLNSSGDLGATSNLTYSSGLLTVSESIKISKSGSGNLQITQDADEPFNVSLITVQGKTGSNFGALKINSKTNSGTSKNLFELKNTYAIFHENIILTGSNKKINFTRASAISGSVFSGSFVGDGSGLTGISTEWDGTRNGDAEITGSLIVSGSGITVDLLGDVTIDQNIEISNRNQTQDLAIGSNALPDSTIDRDTIAIGLSAAYSQVSGSGNILIGQCAGYSGVKTRGNIAIGCKALFYNVGNDTGASTTQTENIAIGNLAMWLSTTARNVVAIGSGAFRSLSTGAQAVAIGDNAGLCTETGIGNTFVGYRAGMCNQVASYGSYFGSEAGMYATGRRNTGIGDRALKGSSSGFTGTCNVGIGNGAGANLSGNSFKNVYIGSNAGPSTFVTQYCQLYIGVNSGETPLIRGNFSTGVVTINSCLKVAEASGSFVGDGSGLTGISGDGFPYNGAAVISGSLLVSQSTAAGTAVTVENGHTILAQVSESLEFDNDTAAAAGGVPLGGLYRSGNLIAIRIT